MKIYIPEPIAEAGEKYLEFQGYEIFRGSGQTDRESLIRDITECEAMILRTAKVDEEVLAAGKKLRIVARHGAGYDNLDVKAAKEKGIITTYSPDTTALSVAETTITLLLMLAKKVKRMEAELRNDNFVYKFSHKGMDVSGKTLGVIGLGKNWENGCKKGSDRTGHEGHQLYPKTGRKRNSRLCKGSNFRAVVKRIRFYQPSCAGRC